MTLPLWCLFIIAALSFIACNSPKEHTAPAIRERDSVAMMTSYGVNTMISDSGVMKYRIIAERWEVNDKLHPQRWIFSRGLFLEQFDDKFHIEAYIQADTAYYFNTEQLWHLVGNVSIRTVEGTKFNSEEIYWDQEKHELYSTKFSRIVTPERQMQGAYFRSDEQLRSYFITNSKGFFMQSDMFKQDTTSTAPADTASAKVPKRSMAAPRQKVQ